MKIIIPAREGSKGFPHKNRILFKYAVKSIPAEVREHVYVTSDDAKILKMARNAGFNCIERPDYLALDVTSMKAVVAHALESMEVSDDELVAILYLTYPERSWTDIIDAVAFYIMMEPAMPVSSLLCKKPAKSSPFLCMYDLGHRGKQIVKHDIYRRQDYPKCFELSHFIVLLRPKSIDNLNNNLYDSETLFWEIVDKIDVDYEKDFLKIHDN
jgi:CMP-N-acetylneuraminic acid synthetase